jgi:formylglycine-generating enzyme required for sulfatase activity
MDTGTICPRQLEGAKLSRRLAADDACARYIPQNLFYPFTKLSLRLLLVILVFLTAGTNIAQAAPTLDAAPQAGSTFRDCPNCPQMTVIPAGQFLMGLSKEDKARDLKQVAPAERTAFVPGITMGAEDYMEQEMPKHPVHIDYSFGLGTYPVMRKEFAAFVQETGYDANGACTIHKGHQYPDVPGTNWQNPGFSQTDRDPVVCVNKGDVEAYIAWLNSKTHGQSSVKGRVLYRFPSEAEWEYAARAGTQTAYWWGDTMESNSAVCDACGNRWDNKQTAPVDNFQANPFGLYDMLGNAWEITADCWNKTYSGATSDGSASVIANCQKYVMRGGSWSTDPWGLRSTSRSQTSPERRANYIGFRVAREII